MTAALPPQSRLRVLLGDPGFDWRSIRTSHDLLAVSFGKRDPYYAESKPRNGPDIIEVRCTRRGSRSRTECSARLLLPDR